MYTVIICCSRRFKKEERLFAKKLRAVGVIVFEPPLLSPPHWEIITDDERMALAAGLTLRHFEKMHKADIVFVFNKGGYIGVSTNLEIGYAAALHKRIFFLEDDDDFPRKILIENIAKSPEELLEKLQKGKTFDITD